MLRVAPVGFEPKKFGKAPRPFQRDCIAWACRKGRAAFFQDCGLGKGLEELEYGRQVCMHAGSGAVLILAPLAVAHQLSREAQKFDIKATLCRKQADVKSGVNITNYEMLEHFDATKFDGVILDESSSIKAYDGARRNLIMDAFRQTPFKLAGTATPAPNDHMELGNHAEFLGVMSRVEMLSMFFTHDGGETQKWRLKGHAEGAFWRWVCDWAIMMRRPSDLGYEDEGFALPPLTIRQVQVEASEETVKEAGMLFAMEARTLSERRNARKASMSARVAKCLEIVAAAPKGETFLIWCDYNAEQDALEEAFGASAFSVQGSDSLDDKEDRVARWCAGERPVMLSKVRCLGFGLNFQHAHRMIFCGLSDSYEGFYQAVRREWRFGQEHGVEVDVVTSALEAAVVRNIQTKEAAAQTMVDAMIGQMSSLTREDLRGTENQTAPYEPSVLMRVPKWCMSKRDRNRGQTHV